MASPKEPWAKLVSLNPKHSHVDITTDEFSIGRVPEECTLAFPDDKMISSKHCSIFRRDGLVFVEDLSSNGTCVNGKKVGKGKQTTVKDGDEISLIAPSQVAMKKAALADIFVAYTIKIMNSEVIDPNSIQANYILEKDIGSGNFATVKLGTSRKTGQKVAIKIIDKKKFALNPSLRKEQLMDEVRVMQSLKHPHILSILDIYESEDSMYLVLEYMRNGDLFDAVVNKTRYPEDEARQLFGQLASAVGYLHDLGVAHRDLKPENILMADANTIKLSDFGLSKIIGEEQLMKTLCGTPQYLAPEIIFQSEGAAEAGYSKAVDIWSMGVILYILLAGYPPFGEASFDQIKKGEYAFHADPWNSISKQAKDLIKKMLTVSPSKRFTINQIFTHPWMKKFKRVMGTTPQDASKLLESSDNPANREKSKDTSNNNNNNNESQSTPKKSKRSGQEEDSEESTKKQKTEEDQPKEKLTPSKSMSSRRTKSTTGKQENKNNSEQNGSPEEETKAATNNGNSEESSTALTKKRSVGARASSKVSTTESDTKQSNGDGKDEEEDTASTSSAIRQKYKRKNSGSPATSKQQTESEDQLPSSQHTPLSARRKKQ